MKMPVMTRDSAQVLALQAVGFLASSEDLLPVFMGATGINHDDLMAGLETPEVQAAVLDFILMDDQWVLAVAAETGHPPEAIQSGACGLAWRGSAPLDLNAQGYR